ncbi:replication endonuclease [Moritella sp. PE36]|uniref:replication endonuclease n=1 Tax=Moritella sp. PE36 TaxID=58051 RepID=UPI0012F773A9|nr:replication endonuclease [Moritella sp. PE36]
MRASSLLRQNSSSVPLSLGRTRPCKTTASPVCWKGKKKQLDWLDSMAIESECGETLELKDVHDASVSNPANRRYELMTQLSGC